MLLEDVIAVYTDILTKTINTHCEQNAELLNVETGGTTACTNSRGFEVLRVILISFSHLFRSLSQVSFAFHIFRMKLLTHSHISHTPYISHPSHPAWFDHPNNSWWWVLMQASSLYRFLHHVTSSLLRGNIFLTTVLKHSQSIFFPYCDRPSFILIKIAGWIYKLPFVFS
jgi:hypothetical protein